MADRDPGIIAKLDKILDILAQQGERIARLEGRIEEQSRVLLTALAVTESPPPASIPPTPL